MKTTPASRRPSAILPQKLDHRICAYSAAALAAGVGLVAAPQQAAAKVVYTAKNVNVAANSPYPIDLNGDGTNDFTFQIVGIDHSSILLLSLDVAGNAVMPAYKPSYEAGALPAGALIGNGQKFTSATSYGGVFMAVAFQYSFSSFAGPWAGVKDRYLGLKFMIQGQVHYGWARLSVDNWRSQTGKALLTGYAYETIANKKITAGDEGTATSAKAAPATTPAAAGQPSLAMLAHGANALAVWRRE